MLIKESEISITEYFYIAIVDAPVLYVDHMDSSQFYHLTSD